MQNFNPNIQCRMNSQVWIRLHELLMEYWDPAFLMDLACGIGEPLRIDAKMLRKELGTYVRILVDVDFTKGIPEEILVQREKFEFLIFVEYKNLPKFCSHCVTLGCDVHRCNVLSRVEGRVGVTKPSARIGGRRPQNQNTDSRRRGQNEHNQIMDNNSEDERGE